MWFLIFRPALASERRRRIPTNKGIVEVSFRIYKLSPERRLEPEAIEIYLARSVSGSKAEIWSLLGSSRKENSRNCTLGSLLEQIKYCKKQASFQNLLQIEVKSNVHHRLKKKNCCVQYLFIYLFIELIWLPADFGGGGLTKKKSPI